VLYVVAGTVWEPGFAANSRDGYGASIANAMLKALSVVQNYQAGGVTGGAECAPLIQINKPWSRLH